MFLKRLILITSLSVFMSLSFGAITFAEEAKVIEKPEEKEFCTFTIPEEKTYNSEVISVRNKLKVEENEIFTVKVFLKNTGTMPWFSNKSTCLGPRIHLGTTRHKDRLSSLYKMGLSGWSGSNRISLDQLRVDPGGIASFTFEAQLGKKGTVYKEFFAPVIKDITWMDEDEFSIYTIVGQQYDTAQNLRKKMDYSISSGTVNSLDLNAEKSVLIDLSEQLMYIKLGEAIIREFPVSTGAARTPTPVGETTIKLKQEVRVAHKAPHYIMPYFQWFRAGGYGFHSLPSLGRANAGIFWTEARSHIQIPVSHGCVRLLPEDAKWLFGYTEVGNKVVVQR